MSHNFSSLKEPKFCFCLPLARGICCGFISLQSTLIIIAILDITMGIASVCIGVILVKFGDLHPAVSIDIFVNLLSCLFGIAVLFAINKKHIPLCKAYLIWKCLEIVIIPVIEIFILLTYKEDKGKPYNPPPASEYAMIFLRSAVRFYLIYLIYSFYKRLVRGETLLVEHGSR